MTWKSTSYAWGAFCILNTGLPSGDITGYTKIIAYLSDFSENADFVKLRIRDTGDNYADVDLREGFNNIDLVALRTSYPSCDFTSIYDITIWNSNTATEGHTIDEGHPASVVISELYLYNPVKTISVGSFGDEITSLDYITGNGVSDPQKFVISDNGTNAKFFKNRATNAHESQNTAVADVPSDAYFYFTLEKVTDSGLEGDNIYRMHITNADGTNYPNSYESSATSYLNSVGNVDFVNIVYAGNTDGYSGPNDALWYVTYDGEKGFSFQNAARKSNGYSSWLTVENLSSSQKYLKLYKSIGFEESTDLEKFDNPSNDALFALSDASGYNAETGILKDGGWTFATPVDLSDWDYMIITVENTSRSTDTYIRITDNSGNYVEKNQYDPGNQPQMYFGTWNNHNVACISMDYLRKEKGLDIFNIKSLSLTGEGLKISSVYLTDYENTRLGPSRGRYAHYAAGDVVRSYDSEGVGKFGTICLPYVASCAGAEVYSIAGKDGSSISLTKVSGLLEAGKPYFYKASDVTGKDASIHNVNFFRADLAKFDAVSPIANNGLIGTFSEITAPDGANYLILSNNKLYNTEGATDDDAVIVGANKAYIDKTAISDLGVAVKAFISFGDDATKINAVENEQLSLGDAEIYNLAGQRMSKLQRGINIVNGKKVLVK